MKVEVYKIYKTKNNNWDFRYVNSISEDTKYEAYVNEDGKWRGRWIPLGTFRVEWLHWECKHPTCKSAQGINFNNFLKRKDQKLCSENYFKTPLEDFEKWAKKEIDTEYLWQRAVMNSIF